MKNIYVGKSMKNAKFKFKTLIIWSLVALLIISISIIAVLFLRFFKELITENTYESQMSNAVKLTDIIDLKLQYQSQIARSISNNEKIQNIVLSKPLNILTQVTNNREVKKILLDYSGSMNGIYSVNIFTKNFSEPLNTVMEGKYAEDVAAYGVNEYSIFTKYVLNNTLYKYKDDIYFNISTDKSLGAPMLTTIKWIKDSNGEQIGVLTILLRLDYLFSSIEEMKSNKAADLYIIDNKEGTTIYDSNYDNISSKFNVYSSLKDIQRMQNGNIEKAVNGKEYNITFKHFNSIDWTVVEIMPYDELFKGFDSVSNKIFGSILAITIIMIILAVVLSNTMTKGLKKLLVHIRNVERGNLTVNIEPSKIAEIDSLNFSFEGMTNQIRNSLIEIEMANKKERDAELIALQAQINPHFLYNTLDAVYWMTDDKDAGEIISSLGKFFRLSLNKGMDVVPVTHELEHVRKYVEIQLKIYRNRFEYIEVIDDSVKEFHVIKLILQPLVENAILHGLNQKKTNGLIKLTASASEGNLIFSVEDNGTGVNIEDMQSILNKVVETKGYGIRNVNERIWLKYGSKYGLYYENKDSGGTIARIILPLIASPANI